MDKKFKQLYSSSIFMGKVSFAIDTWAGASKSLVSKVQAIQDRVAKNTLGKSSAKMSNLQRRQKLNWLSIEQEAKNGNPSFST